MKPYFFLILLLTLFAFGPVMPLCAAPVQVFVLAGQSNMEGHGVFAADAKRNGGKGSLEFLVKDAASAGRFAHLVDDAGQWRVRDDVWVSYLDRKGSLTVGFGARRELIGPELGLGNVLGDACDAPVLLVKCAWGGKSLAVDFRPPGAGKIPYSLGEKADAALAADPALVGKYYRETLALTKAALANLKELVPGSDGTYVLAGFGWHQGWNDRINDRFNTEYESNMAHFIRDMRRDLGVEKLPFVIVETGMNGPTETHPRALSLMKAQAAVAQLPEFIGNVAFVGTKDFWRPAEESPSNQGYHWNSNAETYYLIGTAMGAALLELTKSGPEGYASRRVAGWTVHIKDELLAARPGEVSAALRLMQKQLDNIEGALPPRAIAALQNVRLWMSPEYQGNAPKAEYHPNANWLRQNGRNAAMERGVEISNTRIFEAETNRMPRLMLHELAHAFHHQVLPGGFENAEIKAAYDKAKAAEIYHKVERFHGNGKANTFEKAYALSSPQEYFAEASEAYFGRNDFYPFTREELQKHDPALFALLQKLWGAAP